MFMIGRKGFRLALWCKVMADSALSRHILFGRGLGGDLSAQALRSEWLLKKAAWSIYILHCQKMPKKQKHSMDSKGATVHILRAVSEQLQPQLEGVCTLSGLYIAGYGLWPNYYGLQVFGNWGGPALQNGCSKLWA